ncbi:MAG TPA: hypothetical protein VFE46_02395 [Pirellulales bacterium]|jgi:hypothetical protein|nr:hypothetical protein [Pirellulales bacterium]
MEEALIHLINRADPVAIVALLLIFGGGIIVALISISFNFISTSRKRDAEINLKHEMIARGMSADEIERVLAAKCNSSPGAK